MRVIVDKLPYAVRLARYRGYVEAAFIAHGLPAAWGLAIARQESAFRAGVSVLTGGDGVRGGSYGLMQMSMTTARGLGYAGDAKTLLIPTVNCMLSAKLVAQLRSRYLNLRDVAAAYNSGKPFDRAPHSTRTHYVPNVQRYAQEFGWIEPKGLRIDELEIVSQ